MTMNSTTLILGRGYVGDALAGALPGAHWTRTSPADATGAHAICFRLDAKDSWNRLPQASDIIWTFPARPLHLVEAFHRTALRDCRRLVVYGSTSCYRITDDDTQITEDDPLDLSSERVQGEEYLRRAGACVLVLAGIYGPGREPQDWLRQGLIRTPGKRVNLIHRDDIVAITRLLLHTGRLPAGERVNLADGVSRRWSEIAQRYGIDMEDSGDKPLSKQISNRKLRALLPADYRFRDLFADERNNA